ncbi:mechanosensitive ion channel domain-containing protein [Corynebacterium uberis]|uniref:mechanosensitive ion channel family protein n=1 Tax=Corynebacterium TaxID=1716 RepID=UPI0022BA691A|nr:MULTISPECIES: mechanosensitive ion channel domain-containing protein [Corynebacterium]
MLPVHLLRYNVWVWISDKGLTLALLCIIAVLIPRIGRFAIGVVNRHIEESNDSQDGKTRQAITGVAVYIIQMVAYFLLLVAFLRALGFSLTGAAIPATVASAAIGLGAQSIIADFMAGFFILTEKQYGIGDWVRFEGNGVEVEGTVIQITMRATRIRTLAQETVTIPNSTAKVCVNSSNYWSRAVVVIPVPLLGSRSPADAIERCRASASQALLDPAISTDILGPLEIHPAVDVTPPTTVGMPWMMQMRVMVQVEPGSQWQVERAIRTAIVAEFWEEYGSAPTTSGTLRRTLTDADSPDVADTPTEVLTPPTSPQLPAQPDASPAAAQPEPDDSAEGATGASIRTNKSGKLHGALSLGHRFRPSTTLLVAALGVLFYLQLATVQADDDWQGDDGWLSPNRLFPTVSESTSTPTPTPTPEPAITTPAEEPTPSTPRPSATPERPAEDNAGTTPTPTPEPEEEAHSHTPTPSSSATPEATTQAQ